MLLLMYRYAFLCLACCCLFCCVLLFGVRPQPNHFKRPHSEIMGWQMCVTKCMTARKGKRTKTEKHEKGVTIKINGKFRDLTWLNRMPRCVGNMPPSSSLFFALSFPLLKSPSSIAVSSRSNLSCIPLHCCCNCVNSSGLKKFEPPVLGRSVSEFPVPVRRNDTDDPVPSRRALDLAMSPTV